MDKKKYNQMGFDFGDADPAQESPAAGFRIKSLKPASKADTGESEQENDNQEDITAKNGVNAPSHPTADAGQTEYMPAGKTLETATGKQQGESNPNNDSEVIRNTPVVSEQQAHAQSHEPADEIRQDHHLAEKPTTHISTEPIAGAPEAEELEAVNEVIEEEEKNEETLAADPQAVSTPNIPSKLTRPTQVYAVEEIESESEKKENRNIGFTPASQQPKEVQAAPQHTAIPQQTAAVSLQAFDEATKTPVAVKEDEQTTETGNISAAGMQESQPAADVINDPIATIEISAAEETAQAYNTTQEESTSAEESVEPYSSTQEQASSIPPQTTQEPQEDEYFISEEPGHGVNFNTPEPEPELVLPKKSTRGRKSLKTLDAEAGAVNIPEDSTLFKRQYYSIGEVAGMFGVNQSLLRFWENEFDIIQPRKNRKGDRHFRPVDIKNLELIYDLLRRRKLTIEGAKEFLKKNKQARERFEMIQSLQQIRGFLLEIKASL